MQKFLMLLVLICLPLNFTGCSTKVVTPTSNTTTSVSAFEVAQKALYASGAVLDTVQKYCDGLYDAGKLSKADYNSFVPKYNQALAAFKLAVSALNSAKAINADPTSYSAYVMALADFTSKKNIIDELVTSFGGSK